jgi:hypothetical protein
VVLCLLQAHYSHWHLISKKYGSVVLPDEAVVESLEFQGIHILRTDAYDGEICPVKNKVARDDNRSGGCANFILEW